MPPPRKGGYRLIRHLNDVALITTLSAECLTGKKHPAVLIFLRGCPHLPRHRILPEPSRVWVGLMLIICMISYRIMAVA